jgi:hypothetical protein
MGPSTMQSRAVVPAFLLYATIALFAAYGARVVAENAERTAIADTRREVFVISEPGGERTIDSIDTHDSVTTATADTGRAALPERSRRTQDADPRLSPRTQSTRAQR